MVNTARANGSAAICQSADTCSRNQKKVFKFNSLKEEEEEEDAATYNSKASFISDDYAENVLKCIHIFFSRTITRGDK